MVLRLIEIASEQIFATMRNIRMYTDRCLSLLVDTSITEKYSFNFLNGKKSMRRNTKLKYVQIHRLRFPY